MLAGAVARFEQKRWITLKNSGAGGYAFTAISYCGI